MAIPSLSAVTADTDITTHIRLLADALIPQYALRREEIEHCPTPFYVYLSQLSSSSAPGRSKAIQTMPRRVYDALTEAAAQCTDGDLTHFVVESVRLNSFYLLPDYVSCLFIGNKIAVPHDIVFTVLFHIDTFARLRRVRFKDLALDLCSHITTDIVQYFSRTVNKASPPAQTLVASIHMSTFGINVLTKSHIHGTSLTTKPPSANKASNSHRQFSAPTGSGILSDNTPVDAIPLNQTSHVPDLRTATAPPVRVVSVNGSETATAAPSTPLASKRRPILTQSSSPLGDVNDSSPSPRSPSSLSLTKRLFENEISARRIKKTRILKDSSNNEQQTPGEHEVVESSKKANKLRRRANRSVGKNKGRIVPPMGRNEVVEDPSDEQTSPITKAIPGSFLLHGERLEGVWRKRVVRGKENADVEKGSWW